MSDRREVSQGVNILVLDSGGASGLSLLVILNETMYRLQHSLGLAEPPNVFEHFDIVAGTGTGAIIVCMVGRLRIPIKDAIKYYTMLAEVFSDRKLVGTGTFKTTKLREILKKIIGKTAGDGDIRMMDTRPDANKCRTMVFAMSRHNMNAAIPRIFRSYQGAANQMPDCTLWEAICASMAHPELFKSFEIGEAHMREPFVGGTVGCANPIMHALAEAQTLFPDRHVASVLSIGTGHTRTIQIPKPTLSQRLMPMNVLVAMKDLATDSERAAQDMALRFQRTVDVYFRFNVDQGMQNIKLSDWERLGEVNAHAQTYMRQVETSQKMDRAVKAIRERKATISMVHIDGQIQIPTTQQISGVKLCPIPTPVFTGQEDKIKQATACLSLGDKQRCIFVLHGLGGTGKTQIALKTVEDTLDMWADIVYVDATSRETTISTLEGFAKAKAIGDTHEDTLRWLGTRQERWLMLFDNADDPSLEIDSFFPLGNHGSILVTTRITHLSMVSRGKDSNCKVSSMVPEEALELLSKAAQREGELISDAERADAIQLLEEFGHLALAIAQAGAYIRCSGCTITQYRDMFAKERQTTLERSNELLAKFDKYGRSVYTTWYMSYKSLGPQAQQLLGLMAFMHHDGITEGMFRRAAINLQTYEPSIPTSDEEDQIKAYVENCLQSYLDTNGAWNSGAFLAAMTELTSYSLINYDRVNTAYTLHVLVHDWSSTVLSHTQAIAVEHTTLLIASSIRERHTAEELAYERALELHVSRVLERQAHPSANNAVWLADVYASTGKWALKEPLDILVVDARRSAFGDGHPDTLMAISNLAMTHFHQGRFQQAEQAQTHVLSAYRRLHGDEHPYTRMAMNNLASNYLHQGQFDQAEAPQLQTLGSHGEYLFGTLQNMSNLAMIYYNQGRFGEAEELQTKLLGVCTQFHGAEHPDSMRSLNNLALTYWRQGRLDKAEALQMDLLNTQKRVLGEGHPDTLLNTDNLASTYCSQGRFGEAEELQLQVLDAYMELYGKEHPDTMHTMNNLGLTYWNQGRFEQAGILQTELLEMQQRVLGEGHPSTLLCTNNLALTCQGHGRYDRAEELLLHALGAYKQLHGDEHPDTLLTMSNLASTYVCQGRFEQAEALQTVLLETQKRVLGEDHPSTLNNTNNLAMTYLSQGRLGHAEELQLQILSAYKRLHGDQHPGTLTSISNLASTYWKQGRFEQAEALQVDLMVIQKRVLGENHPCTLNNINNLAVTYGGQGRLAQAEVLHLQVVDAYKKSYGEEHPDTLTAMNNLAWAYWSRDQFEQAEELQIELLEIHKRLFGEHHPRILKSMENLATIYASQCRFEHAEAVQTDLVEIQRRVFGGDHPNTLESAHKLAFAYHKQGKLEQAEELLLHILGTYRRLYGDEHSKTVLAMRDLVSTYVSHNQFEQAEQLQVQALGACKQLYGDNHPETLTVMNNLASIYLGQGQFKQAEQMQVQTMCISKQTHGNEHPATLLYMGNLAFNYWKQNRFDEAVVLESQVVDASERVLGFRHPRTLDAMKNLAGTYNSLGLQYQLEHEALQVRIAELQEGVE